jgi:Protein of unknown function (DUF3102)
MVRRGRREATTPVASTIASAGEMLIEAKDQVSHGAWGTWLSKNFDLSSRTAQHYMQWARVEHIPGGSAHMPASMNELTGGTERRREDRQSKQQQDLSQRNRLNAR